MLGRLITALLEELAVAAIAGLGAVLCGVVAYFGAMHVMHVLIQQLGH